MNIIEFQDVWEMYRIKFSVDGKSSWEDYWALKEISFAVKAGETVGIIGENGAGKSTILKLVMGMLTPDRGKVTVAGKAAGLLELGAGFQPELTGRENIFLNAGLFGLSQAQTENKYNGIVSFADLGKFINAPVKCYSQGMFVRLAFAIAINMDSDILVIDDTLAVGDEHFQRKCIKKIFELKDQGKTIILVTHAMHLLHRLCARTIFLKDGAMVKDGATAQVLPLYTQMVGSKEGVGVLESGALRAVFNNGRLFINWKDRLLTPHSGAYTTFLMGNKWYSSLQADWQVTKESVHTLTATGALYQLEMTQVWQFEVNQRHEISWDIELASASPFEIQEGYTNIMVSDEYTSWFTPLEKGVFPVIEFAHKNWQPLLSGDVPARCIGVVPEATLSDNVPSLIFKQSAHTSVVSSQILNTDYLVHARVLQYKTAGLQNYSADQSDRLVYFSGQITLDTADIDHYLGTINEESSVANGALSLAFHNGRGILKYNGIDVTVGSHIGTAFFINGRWYASGLAHWDIEKPGEDTIILKGRWPHLPLIQTWEIQRWKENSFTWAVNMQLSEDLDVEQQHFFIMCRRHYTHWFSKYGTGMFPEGFQDAEMDMVQRCIPDGDIGLMSQEADFPALSLKFSNKYNTFAKIFNSNIYNKSRLLRIEKVESEDNIRFLTGSYPCFKLEIACNKGARVDASHSTILQGKRVRFQFDNGRGRLFWEGRELTKRLGLYTSVRSRGRWHDSASSALWKIEARDDKNIRAFGQWLYLPISQSWSIVVAGEDTIEFTVTMRVDKDVEVDRMQTNLMVSERYVQWLISDRQGTFPSFKEDISDDWDSVWSAGAGVAYIGVSVPPTDRNALPGIKLCGAPVDSPGSVRIINSDIFHRGRVLQYVDANAKQLSSSDFLYFKGKIIIG